MKPALRTLLAAAVTAAVAVPAAIWAWPHIGELAARTAVLAPPTEMDIVLVPHPGDEFQAWSLLEDDPSSYKVFVLLTRGEESRGSGDLESWVEGLEAYATVDESLTADLQLLGTQGPFTDERNTVCRTDRGDVCTAVRTAEVWTDSDGRGAVVAFDLGDGDLTRGEVTWAIQTLKGNREALGIDTTLRPAGLIGAAFANSGYDCVRFENPDHIAVHKALYNNNYFVEYQAAPTCADDPDASRSGVVSPAAVDIALPPANEDRSTRRIHGSHPTVDDQGQRRIFHTHQEFWVRVED